MSHRGAMSASVDTQRVTTVTLDVDGQRLHVSRTAGQGVPLLIIGDYAAGRDMLAPFCQALERPTIAFDWPGLDGQDGASWAASRLRMPARARVVAALLTALDVARVDILGMGWGGLLAQEMARSQARHLRALVLVATSTGQTMWPGRWSALRRLARVRGLAGIAGDAREARDIFGGRADADCRAVAATLADAPAAHPAALAGQLYAVAGFSSLAWAHRLELPTLILAGDDDRIVPLANARLLQLLIPRAELSVMHAAGHWLLIERRDEAVRRVEAFLALFEGA